MSEREIELPPRPKRYSTTTGVLRHQVEGRINTWSETVEDENGSEVDATEFAVYADEIERQLRAEISAHQITRRALEMAAEERFGIHKSPVTKAAREHMFERLLEAARKESAAPPEPPEEYTDEKLKGLWLKPENLEVEE